ncbi:MAG: hypothetical protein HY718_02240 [Planctomycetes bacterium]|nr:hypothetical protein [Planctomycetota bacterium]
MVKVGYGFGDAANGDFDFPALVCNNQNFPVGPAGLLGDGTASFLDTDAYSATDPAHASAGFYQIGLGATFTIDLRLKANYGLEGNATFRRAMGIHDRSAGANIRISSNGAAPDNGFIEFIDGSGTRIGSRIQVPALRCGYKALRFSVSGSVVTVYDMESGTTPWPVLAAVNLSTTQQGNYYGPVRNGGGGFHVNSIDATANYTTKMDFSLDWLRINSGEALGAEDPVIVRLPLPSCRSVVLPEADVAAFALTGQPADPSQAVYTVINGGANTVNYSISEVDAQGLTLDHAWLSLDKDSTALNSEQSDKVTATIDAANLDPGVHTAYVRFTDDCDPATVQTRRIVLTVQTCPWTIAPVPLTEPGQDWAVRARSCPAGLEYPFTVRNTGTSAMEFTVEESNAAGDARFDWPEIGIDDAHWDSITGQPIATTVQPGATDTVVVTTTPQAGDVADFKNVHLLFRTLCTPPDKLLRTIRVDNTVPTAPLILRYDGAVDPDTPDSFGPGYSFELPAETGNAKQGMVLDNPLAVDGKVWRIVDTGTSKERWLSSPSDGVDSIVPTRGATIVARVKVEAATDDQGGNILVFDEAGLSAGYHFSGPGSGGANGGRIAEVRRNLFNSDDPARANSDFHILRMTVIGGGDTGYGRAITFYFDENPVPVGQVADAAAISTYATDYFGFGADHLSSTQTISFDWVSATPSGAFAPGQELACLGRSLVVGACPDPFADADRDGDVDPVDFAAWQRCLTGLTLPVTDFGPPVNCGCFDRNGDGHVSAWDFADFEDCASGPGVPAAITCDD